MRIISLFNCRLLVFLYSAQIFVFAVIYSYFFPNDFFHSTARMEPTLQDDIQFMSDEVQHHLRKDRGKLNLDEYFGNNEIYVHLRTNVTDEIVVDIYEGLGVVSASGVLSLTRAPDDFRIMGNFRKDNALLNEYEGNLPIWTLLDYKPSEEFVILFNGWKSALRGQPSRTKGLFCRMFYLSVVTTTTLGYGDIVPLTNATRMLISFQSILGLVLIALIVNSLITSNRQ